MAQLDLGELTFTGQHVVLRPLQASDAPALAAAAAQSRESYAFNNVPEGLPAAEAYVAHALRQRADGMRYPFCIRFQGQVVGTSSYSEFQPWRWPAAHPQQRDQRPDAVEIGHTWLAASAQRTACNTEAKYLLIRHAFETWRVHCVSLRTDERNQRSRRAIERLGFRFEGIRRAHCPGADGSVRSSAFFSMLAAEWPSANERLKTLLLRS